MLRMICFMGIFLFAVLFSVCKQKRSAKSCTNEIVSEFLFVHPANALKALSRIENFFNANKNKYHLKFLNLVGQWKDKLVVKYELIGNSKVINFNEIIGDVIAKDLA